ncbi:MAG: hypothetical protein IKQ76_03550 [Bacteroidales bacterium]|nr:hypothetical protein [Bacteroidales bacterium]
MFASEVTIIRDTISVIDSGQVAAFYSDILEKQSAQYGLLITVLIAVFTALLGVSWWCNNYGMKRQIRNEVEVAKKELETQIDSWKETSKKDIESLLSEKEKGLSEQLRKEMKHHEAELDKLYAVSCLDGENYISGAEWLIKAFCLYMEEDEGAMMEICLKNFVHALKKVAAATAFDDDISDRIDKIEKKCKSIPDIYSSQRTEAYKCIKDIRRKISTVETDKDKK